MVLQTDPRQLIPQTLAFDARVEAEFNKLIEGEEMEYGYILACVFFHNAEDVS
jgi:hypothetical protein